MLSLCLKKVYIFYILDNIIQVGSILLLLLGGGRSGVRYPKTPLSKDRGYSISSGGLWDT